MKAFAYIQLPEPNEKPIHVDVSITDDILMLFEEGNSRKVFEMQKPEIMHVNAHGMMLKGYQPNGVARGGILRFLYKEVFLSWINPETKQSYFEAAQAQK